MNDKKHFFKAGKIRFAMGTVLLGTLTGCVVDQPPQRSVYVAPPAVYVAPPVVQTTVVVQDDYVYYPNYQVYYSSRRHQYAYLEGGAWVSRPAPHGVSVNVLLASPSVRMNFHDSPANHHAMVVQQYPKNWRPPGANQGHEESEKENQHGYN
jgi:hypothetical protein